MKQLACFLKKIRVRRTTEQYQTMNFEASLHKAELQRTLEEILGEELDSGFDDDTDKRLEQLALKRLQERQAKKNV